MIVRCNLCVFISSSFFLVKTLSHFEQFRTVLLGQFAVEHCDCSLQVSPLLCYFLLSFLQLLQLLLSLPPQSLQVLTLLLVQETMEVLKLGADLSFQGIKTALKDGKGKGGPFGLRVAKNSLCGYDNTDNHFQNWLQQNCYEHTHRFSLY